MTALTRRRSLAFPVGAFATIGITPVAAPAAVKSFVAFDCKEHSIIAREVLSKLV